MDYSRSYHGRMPFRYFFITLLILCSNLANLISATGYMAYTSVEITVAFSEKIDGSYRHVMSMNEYGYGRIEFQSTYDLANVTAKLETSRDGAWCYVEMQLPTTYSENTAASQKVLLREARGRRITSRFSDRVTYTGDLQRAVAIICDAMGY